MKQRHALVSFAIFTLLTTSCSTSYLNKTRKIASTEIPVACQMQLPNPVTKITHTVINNGSTVRTEIPNSAVTIACKNGMPVYAFEFSSAKYGNSSFATEQLLSGQYHSGLYSDKLGLYAQPSTSKMINEREQDRDGGLISNYTIQNEINKIRIQLDPTGEKRHKEFCARTARPIEITEPSTQNESYACQARLLPRSPIANMNINGVILQSGASFVCFNGQPRYKIKMDVPNSNEIEYLDFGISDGTTVSSTYYHRILKTNETESLIQNKKGEHKINVLESGTIGFPLKNNRLLRVNFDKEMLAKHQEWCAIGLQTQSYATPPVTDGTVTPQQTDDVVPLIEN